MADSLSEADKRQLLTLAREALEAAVRGQPEPPVDEAALSPSVTRPGCCFVTLSRRGNLRGCIGALQPMEALFEDVRHHAVQAALDSGIVSGPYAPQVKSLEEEWARYCGVRHALTTNSGTAALHTAVAAAVPGR